MNPPAPFAPLGDAHRFGVPASDGPAAASGRSFEGFHLAPDRRLKAGLRTWCASSEARNRGISSQKPAALRSVVLAMARRRRRLLPKIHGAGFRREKRDNSSRKSGQEGRWAVACAPWHRRRGALQARRPRVHSGAALQNVHNSVGLAPSRRGFGMGSRSAPRLRSHHAPTARCPPGARCLRTHSETSLQNVRNSSSHAPRARDGQAASRWANLASVRPKTVQICIIMYRNSGASPTLPRSIEHSAA
jgi:hypothetical protein